MFKFKSHKGYLLLGIFGLSLPIFTTISLNPIKPALACRVAGTGATLAQKVNNAPIVFQGVVTKIEGDTLTIQVSEYFKNNGQKPRVVNLKGFNGNSCQDMISQPGTRFLFFAETGKKSWNAVYDVGFGSVRPWNAPTATELSKLGFIGMSPGNTPPRPTQPIDPDCVSGNKRLPKKCE